MTTEISVMYGSEKVKQIKNDNSRDQQDEGHNNVYLPFMFNVDL